MRVNKIRWIFFIALLRKSASVYAALLDAEAANAVRYLHNFRLPSHTSMSGMGNWVTSVAFGVPGSQLEAIASPLVVSRFCANRSKAAGPRLSRPARTIRRRDKGPANATGEGSIPLFSWRCASVCCVFVLPDPRCLAQRARLRLRLLLIAS